MLESFAKTLPGKRKCQYAEGGQVEAGFECHSQNHLATKGWVHG
jgi:hypothetical protein